MRLAPGEATPWHRDALHRVTVVLAGDDWDEPTDRIHRAVNSGGQPYEEVTVFFLDRPDAVPQPKEA